jgi:hypothetical protein
MKVYRLTHLLAAMPHTDIDFRVKPRQRAHDAVHADVAQAAA